MSTQPTNPTNLTNPANPTHANPKSPLTEPEDKHLITVMIEEHIWNFHSLKIAMKDYLIPILDHHSKGKLSKHLLELKEDLNSSSSNMSKEKNFNSYPPTKSGTNRSQNFISSTKLFNGHDNNKYILYKYSVPCGSSDRAYTSNNNSSVTMLAFDNIFDFYNAIINLPNGNNPGLIPEAPLTFDFKRSLDIHRKIISNLPEALGKFARLQDVLWDRIVINKTSCYVIPHSNIHYDTIIGSDLTLNLVLKLLQHRGTNLSILGMPVCQLENYKRLFCTINVDDKFI
jgi:hypothetical protein